MKRHRYQFRTRAEAETAFRTADTNRCIAEQLATAILQNRIHWVGSTRDGSHTLDVGYFTLRFSARIVAIVRDSTEFHTIRGLWDSDDDNLPCVISALMRHDDSHEFGRLLDHARYEAYQWFRRENCAEYAAERIGE